MSQKKGNLLLAGKYIDFLSIEEEKDNGKDDKLFSKNKRDLNL